MLQSSENCPDAFENGHPFVIDLPDQALYIQADLRKETTAWFQAISAATSVSYSGFILNITFMLHCDKLIESPQHAALLCRGVAHY